MHIRACSDAHKALQVGRKGDFVRPQRVGAVQQQSYEAVAERKAEHGAAEEGVATAQARRGEAPKSAQRYRQHDLCMKADPISRQFTSEPSRLP